MRSVYRADVEEYAAGSIRSVTGARANRCEVPGYVIARTRYRGGQYENPTAFYGNLALTRGNGVAQRRDRAVAARYLVGKCRDPSRNACIVPIGANIFSRDAVIGSRGADILSRVA